MVVWGHIASSFANAYVQSWLVYQYRKCTSHTNTEWIYRVLGRLLRETNNNTFGRLTLTLTSLLTSNIGYIWYLLIVYHELAEKKSKTTNCIGKCKQTSTCIISCHFAGGERRGDIKKGYKRTSANNQGRAQEFDLIKGGSILHWVSYEMWAWGWGMYL